MPRGFKKWLKILLLIQGIIRMLLPLFEYHLFELTQFKRLIFILEFLKSALFKFSIRRLHSLLWVFVHLLILDNAQHLDCLGHRTCTCAFYLYPAAMQFNKCYKSDKQGTEFQTLPISCQHSLRSHLFIFSSSGVER